MFIRLHERTDVSARLSWRLLITEYLLAINASQAIMPLFCLSIGLTQGEIGVKEVMCSIVYLIFSIPTGWLADRVSRKLCNFVGDASYGTALVILGVSNSFIDAVIAGVIMAFGNASTQGADEALFKAHCDKLGKEYADARKHLWQVISWIEVGYYLAGGLLTMFYGMKTTILISSIPFFAAAVVSCFVKELGIHKEVTTTHSSSIKERFLSELKGLAKVIQYALYEDRKLSWLLVTFAVAAVMGGPIMGLVGPMILAAGGTEGLAGASHVVISLASICGGWLSRNMLKTWHPLRFFLAMSSASLLVMALTSIHFTPWTAGLHIVFVQVIRVWLMYNLRTLVHEAAPDDIQATIGSLMDSATQMLYMVVVLVINFAAGYGVRWGIAANALLFTPLVVITVWQQVKTSRNF